MNVLDVNMQRFSGLAEALYCQYESVRELYPYDYHRPEEWVRRVAWLDAHPGADRGAVAQALTLLNGRLGGGEATMANAALLAQPETLAVVTGQQVGLFTGPLLTLYKAVTAVKQAHTLSRSTGRPVVPVFWMATEDHDYAEIAENWHFDGSRPRRIRLDRAHRGNVPVGALPVTETLRGLCRSLCEAMGEEPHSGEMQDLLENTLRESKTLGDWFGRLMLVLFKPWGLVVLDPSMPELRVAARSFFDHGLKHASAIEQAFHEGTGAVSARGFRPEVTMAPRQTGFFIIEEGQRLPLYLTETGDRFTDRQEKHQWPLETLLQRLENQPECFSTGVTLRPVLQDWLLPVAAAVLGPSETAYHGQLGGVFSLFDRQLPVLIPRESWVLAPKTDGISPDELLDLLSRHPEEWIADRIMDLADNSLRDRLNRYQSSANEALMAFTAALPIDEDTRKILNARGLNTQARDMQWMRRQLRRAMPLEQGNRYRTAARMLRPMGRQQDRTLMPWYFLSVYGPALITMLTASDYSSKLRIVTGGPPS